MNRSVLESIPSKPVLSERHVSKKPRHNTSSSDSRNSHSGQRHNGKKSDTPRIAIELSSTSWHLVFLSSGRRFFHNRETHKSYWNAPTQDIQNAYDDLETDELIKLVAQARGLRLDDYKDTPDNESIEEAVESPETQQDPPTTTNLPQERRIEIVDAEEDDVDEQQEESEDEQEDADEGEIHSEASSPGQDLSWIYAKEDDEDFDEEDIFAEPETLIDTEEVQGSYNDPYADGDKVNAAGPSPNAIKAFKEMLSDYKYKVNPFSTWEREYPKFVNDLRYDELETTSERRQVFDEWTAEEIQRRRAGYKAETTEDSAAIDVHAQVEDKAKGSVNTSFEVNTSEPICQFLWYVFQNFKKKKHPYYIDFKRKFRNDPGFTAPPIDRLPDKDKESLFRSFAVWAKKDDKEERKAAVRSILASYVDAGVDGGQEKQLLLDKLKYKNDLPIEVLREPKFYALSAKHLMETIDQFVKDNES